MQVGNRLSGPLLMQQLPQLGRIGAPVGYYALDDLDLLPPRRLYVFLNCFAPTAEHRRQIAALQSDGRVLVWLYAPGLYRDGQLDEAAMEDLTGLRLRLDRTARPLQVQLVGVDPALDGTTYGTDLRVDPVVYVDDPAATVWGRLAEGNQAGLVVREFGDWTSVFSAAPALPSGLLRRLAKQARVHLYLEPTGPSADVVYANRSLLALCADAAGPRTVRLPGPSDVFDLFAGQEVGQGLTEFTVEMAEHETKLWRVRPR
jgi:hypothetical protein